MDKPTNKYKKLMGNTMIFGVGQILAKVIGFLLVALYTRYMTKDEYSDTDLIYNTINVIVPLVTFSMADAVIRFGMDKAYDGRQVFTCANTALMLGMGIFMLFTPLVAGNKFIGEYTLLLYISCYFSCFRQIASQFVRAKGQVRLFMADGVVAVFNQLLLNVLLIVVLKLGVTGYVLSIIISDAISLVWLFLLAGLYKLVDTKFFSMQLLKEMLKFSAPLIPTYILWWITAASDRWFVVYMIGKAENSVYSASYKLPTLLMLVTTMFYQAWQMSSIEEKDSKGLNKFYENVFGAYSSLIFIGAAGLILLVRPLTSIIVPMDDPTKDYTLTSFYTPILIISMVFQCFCQFLSSVYTTRKRSLNSLYTSLVAALPNLLLNYLLIPHIGVWGAAIATAFSYFACFAVRLYDVRRIIWFRVNYMRLIVNIVMILAMIIITVKQPFLWVLWELLIFLVVLLFDFQAIIATLKRILKGGRISSAAASRSVSR